MAPTARVPHCPHYDKCQEPLHVDPLSLGQGRQTLSSSRLARSAGHPHAAHLVSGQVASDVCADTSSQVGEQVGRRALPYCSGSPCRRCVPERSLHGCAAPTWSSMYTIYRGSVKHTESAVESQTLSSACCRWSVSCCLLAMQSVCKGICGVEPLQGDTAVPSSHARCSQASGAPPRQMASSMGPCLRCAPSARIVVRSCACVA
jgi:hypothetical protein